MTRSDKSVDRLSIDGDQGLRPWTRRISRTRIKNPNFLILDEPTNDLDLLTLNKLEEFLEGYSGCLVLVSHDRYFMDQLVDHLFIFDGSGLVKDYNDTYSAFRSSRQLLEGHPNSGQLQEEKDSSTQKSRPSNKEKNEFRKIEREINSLENEKADLEKQLANETLSLDKINAISEQIGKVMQTIDRKTERWMELAEKF